MFRFEVQADSSGEWCHNARVFASASDAKSAAVDLACRWVSVRAWRVTTVAGDVVPGREYECSYDRVGV